MWANTAKINTILDVFKTKLQGVNGKLFGGHAGLVVNVLCRPAKQFSN